MFGIIKMKLWVILAAVVMITTVWYFKSILPSREDAVEIGTDRCDVIANEGLTVQESKNLYDQLCGHSHPLWNCRAIGESEFHWECWGFREGIDPKSNPTWDDHPSKEK